MTIRLRTILCGTLCLFQACSDGGSAPTTPGDPDESDLIREAVFRYQFLHNESGQQQSAQVYFLSVMVHPPPTSSAVWTDADPSPALLARFSGFHPPVRPWSRCTTSLYGVVDRQTGEHGLLFNVNEITVFDGDSAHANGGYFEGGLSASGNTYHLRRIAGSWLVMYDILQWISAPAHQPGSSRRIVPE